MFETLDDTNFLLYAAKHYENPNGDLAEFEEDLNRIKYIKRLLSKYRSGRALRERLLLNHLITLYNVFHHKACTRMLCFRLYDELEYLKPFLIYLSYWPERVEPIGTDQIVIKDAEVPMDQTIIDILRTM